MVKRPARLSTEEPSNSTPLSSSPTVATTELATRLPMLTWLMVMVRCVRTVPSAKVASGRCAPGCLAVADQGQSRREVDMRRRGAGVEAHLVRGRPELHVDLPVGTV